MSYFSRLLGRREPPTPVPLPKKSALDEFSERARRLNLAPDLSAIRPTFPVRGCDPEPGGVTWLTTGIDFAKADHRTLPETVMMTTGT